MKCDVSNCNGNAQVKLVSLARPDEIWVCCTHYHDIITDPDLEGMWTTDKVVKHDR